MTADQSGQPPFDLEKARSMLNKRVMIGLTHKDHDGKFIRQEQMHGVIVSVDNLKGFEIQLEGSNIGRTYMLPPDLRSFEAAKPGEYRERSTGDTVVDPDLLSSWVINKAPRNSEDKSE